MKPTRNRFYCPACNKPKMQFATQKKAERFLLFNAEEILQESGRCPVRAYYCDACASWHTTSLPSFSKLSSTDIMARRYGITFSNKHQSA